MKSLIYALFLVIFLISCSKDGPQVVEDTGQIKAYPGKDEIRRIASDHNKFLKGDSTKSVANLDSIDLSGEYQDMESTLIGKDWRYASFVGTSFNGTYLGNRDLSFANLAFASLIEADLLHPHAHSGIDTDPVKFHSTNLYNVLFEPAYLPTALNIVTAKNLYTLRYNTNPAPLIKLMNSFRESGFLDQERQIVCALMREKTKRLESVIEKWLRTILLDWTCSYGMNVWRPIRILFYQFVFFTLIYTILLCHEPKSGLVKKKIEQDITEKRYSFLHIGTILENPTLFQRLERFGNYSTYSFLFSLMSSFNYGFRDINFGRWIRNILLEDYDIQPRRWSRTASGIQSIISLYLFALWLFIYFGRPFQQLI